MRSLPLPRSTRSPRSSGTSRGLGAGAVLAAGAVALAACGSGGTEQPAGLTGNQASNLVNQQFTAQDRAAAKVLAPAAGSFLAGKTTVTELGSTTPANGDVNPYAVWPVTETIGSVTTGDVLVDNFNNKSNDQGTGTTIVNVHPNGQTTVFAQLPTAVPGCPGGVGLTTAMVQLRTGWVIVGSLPTSNGKIATAGSGCLLELSPTGKLAATISGSYLDGPWDAALSDNGATATLYVTNTLVGGVVSAGSDTVDMGSVERLSLSQTATTPPKVTAVTQIAGGLAERQDAGALVKGPTGLALGPTGTLYIADNLGNRITSVADAARAPASRSPGVTLTQGGQLSNPLGLVEVPGGDLVAANATNGKVVEISPSGHQVGSYYAIQDVGQDPPGNGDLFGLAVDKAGLLLVKDDTNTLALLH